MSYVWSVMLSFDNEELWEEGVDSSEVCEPMKQINSWIVDGQLA